MLGAILLGCLAIAGIAGRELLAAVGVDLVPTFDPEKFELAEWAVLLDTLLDFS